MLENVTEITGNKFDELSSTIEEMKALIYINDIDTATTVDVDIIINELSDMIEDGKEKLIELSDLLENSVTEFENYDDDEYDE